jgi:hypothetical protein
VFFYQNRTVSPATHLPELPGQWTSRRPQPSLARAATCRLPSLLHQQVMLRLPKELCKPELCKFISTKNTS